MIKVKRKCLEFRIVKKPFILKTKVEKWSAYMKMIKY